MASISHLDRIGVGIDTARYGHRVSFLRSDHQPVAKPLTVLENKAGYRALQQWAKLQKNLSLPTVMAFFDFMPK